MVAAAMAPEDFNIFDIRGRSLGFDVHGARFNLQPGYLGALFGETVQKKIHDSKDYQSRIEHGDEKIAREEGEGGEAGKRRNENHHGFHGLHG